MPEIVNINEEIYESCLRYFYDETITYSSKVSDPENANINTEYVLGEGTEYFIYSFRGESIYDEIKITLDSVNYNEPIGLDWFNVGSNAPFNQTSLPYSFGSNNTLIRTVSLKKFTISEGDKIKIEIKPNPNSTDTNWRLQMGCANNLNCGEICTKDLSPSQKLDIDEVRVDPPDSNGYVRIFVPKVECDVDKPSKNLFGLSETSSGPSSLRLPTCGTGTSSFVTTCTVLEESYTVVKSDNKLSLTFGSESDLNLYLNNWNEAVNLFSDEPYDVDYYGYVYFSYYYNESVGSCVSDNLGTSTIYISPKSPFVVDGNNLTFNLVNYTNPFSEGDVFYSCVENIISNIDRYLGDVFTKTYPNKLSLNNPFKSVTHVNPNLTPNTTVSERYSYYELNNISNITTPFKLNQSEPITPNLLQFNDQVISEDEININDGTFGSSRYYTSYYRFEFSNDLLDYTIFTKLIADGELVGNNIPIYEFIGGVGTVLNPDYIKQ